MAEVKIKSGLSVDGYGNGENRGKEDSFVFV